MPAEPWYRRYSELSEKVAAAQEEYHERCRALGQEPANVLSEVYRDLIARLVHESNWQEGIFLDRGRTRELLDAVFDDPAKITGAHLDFSDLVDLHRRAVVRLKRTKASVEEVAAVNLSRAHYALNWIGADLANRQLASVVYALKQFQSRVSADQRAKIPDEIQRGFDLVKSLEQSKAPVNLPLTNPIATEGEWLQSLLSAEFDDLVKPMKISHVQFLHRITMMGILPPKKCGSFRKGPIHVGEPDVHFPPPSVLPGLMREYCEQFPPILPVPPVTPEKWDWIMEAARASYGFVRIHPYIDGNGRISRLLMNLVLWSHHPPVSIKADKKGRHRYGQALRRANRGNVEPLACLIADSLIETYGKLIDAVSPRRSTK